MDFVSAINKQIIKKKKIIIKHRSQKCAQFKVNAHKHLTHHIVYVSQKVNTQQAVATLLDRKTYVMVTF